MKQAQVLPKTFFGWELGFVNKVGFIYLQYWPFGRGNFPKHDLQNLATDGQPHSVGKCNYKF